MLDITTLTEVGVAAAVIGAAALVPTTLGWLETRRQRLLAEGALRADLKPVVTRAAKTVWRCGIYEYPPLSHWPAQRGLEPSGPFVVLAHEVARSLGKSATCEPFSYEDFYKGSDRIPDMVVGMFKTARRAEHVAFSRPVYKIGLQGICRRDQQGDILKGLREGNLSVAVYYGEVGWEFVEDELKDACEQNRVVKLIGGHQLDTMNHLTEGTYDVVIMDSLACANFLAEKDHRKKFRIAFDQPLDKFDACVSVRPENRDLLPTINNAIEQIRNSRDFLDMENEALAGFDKIIERRALRA
ncbi:MAG: transporter substrate-binding domain-containing protein [Rhizomicrobium sp.]